jgi:hypothetical protein
MIYVHIHIYTVDLQEILSQLIWIQPHSIFYPLKNIY